MSARWKDRLAVAVVVLAVLAGAAQGWVSWASHRDVFSDQGHVDTGVHWRHSEDQTDTALDVLLVIRNGYDSAGSARWVCGAVVHLKDGSDRGWRSWDLTLAPGERWRHEWGPYGESSPVAQVEASCGPR